MTYRLQAAVARSVLKTRTFAVGITLGIAVGYYFGYDHGWEKAVAYLLGQ